MNTVRDQLSGDVADLSTLIKGLLIRAEDSRLMRDMHNMRKYYSQLHNINQELLAQYKVRCQNHEQLVDTLKQINQIIQKAGKLRGYLLRNLYSNLSPVGPPKTAVIAACREAIQQDNHEALPKIIKYGI